MPKQSARSDWLKPSYLDAVEGLGDILVFVISRNAQPETVARCLDELAKPVASIIANQDMAIADHLIGADEKTLGYAVYFTPEDALKNFYAPIIQVVRGLGAAVSAQNDETIFECLSWLRSVFRDIVSERDSEALLKVWLTAMSTAADTVRRTDHPWLTSSLTHGWYISELFQHFDFRSQPFNLEYLQPLSDWVFEQVQRSVRADDDRTFRNFYSSLVDMVSEMPPGDVEPYELREVFYYLDMPHEDAMAMADECRIDFLVNLIGNSEKVAVDADSYERAMRELRKTHECVDERLDSQTADTFKEKCKGTVLRLNHAVRMAKLEELTFAVVAYAMYQREYDRIQGMLRYNQPEGATGTWLNREPLPDSIDAFTRGLVLRWLTFGNFNHFDSHLDGRGLKTWAGGLLLARLCLKHKVDPKAVTPIEWLSSESFFEPSRANGVVQQCESIKDMLSSRELTREEAEFIAPHDSGDVGKGIVLAIEVLETTKTQAVAALNSAKASHPISEVRKAKHRQGVVEHLGKTSDIRLKLLRAHPALYAVDFGSPPQGKRLGHPLCHNRDAFLDAWWESPQLGHTEGEGLAKSEVGEFTATLVERLQPHAWSEIAEFLSELGDSGDWIALCSQRDSRMRLFESDVFRWKHEPDSPELGELFVDDMSIPVYQMRFWIHGSEGMAVVRLSTFGKLVQESPFDAEDNLANQFGFIYADYSDRNPDDQSVTVLVTERLTHIPAKDFEGHFFAFRDETDEDDKQPQ